MHSVDYLQNLIFFKEKICYSEADTIEINVASL